MIIRKRFFYGWVIVGSLSLVMFIAYVVRDSFPLFYVPMLSEFGRSRAETALISSISFLVYGFSSALSGALLDKFGPRKLFTAGAVLVGIGLAGCSQATELWHIYLFWGVVFSLGMSAIGFVPCNAVVSRWFVRKRATALGIVQAGGRESFVISPLTQFLIMTFGWRNTYVVFAAMATIIIVSIAQFLRHSPEDIGLLPDGENEATDEKETRQSERDSLIVNKEWAAKDWTLAMAIKKYRFWAFLGMSFCVANAYGMVLSHEVAFMVDVGFTAMFASYLLLIYGITGMAGRLSGFIADKIGREVTYTLGCGGVILGFAMLLLTRDTSAAWMLYVFTVCFGFFGGMNGPTIVAAEVDIFQGKHLGAIIGFINIGFGIGNAIGSWFGGYLFDTFGNYVYAFVTAIIMAVLACVFMWIASPRKIRVVKR
ncbi:MFS transporter [Chloroflexota bacterium]